MKRGFITFLIAIMSAALAWGWEVDFSRRRKPASSEPQPLPAYAPPVPAPAESMNSAEQESLTRPVHENTQMNMPPVAQPKGMELSAPVRKLVAPRFDRRTVDRQAFVILNTEKGFVPSNIRIFRGGHYLVHVVNVNENKKNVSFILDAFREHHSTYFGKIKTFELSPDQEGVFEFQCPETSAEGRLVVLGTKNISPVSRKLSSAEKAPQKEDAPKEDDHSE